MRSTELPNVGAVLSASILFAALMACNARATSTSGAASSQTRTSAATAASAATARVTIPVDGMSCGACAARLKRAVKEVDGVIDVDVSLEPSQARIRYDPQKTSPEKLVVAIRALDLEPGTPVAAEGP